LPHEARDPSLPPHEAWAPSFSPHKARILSLPQHKARESFLPLSLLRHEALAPFLPLNEVLVPYLPLRRRCVQQSKKRAAAEACGGGRQRLRHAEAVVCDSVQYWRRRAVAVETYNDVRRQMRMMVEVCGAGDVWQHTAVELCSGRGVW